MDTKMFRAKDGSTLVIKSRKNAVIFELEEGENIDEHIGFDFLFQFDKDTFMSLFGYIKEIAESSWGELTPKEADSPGADYFEYYDRKLDSNGYLRIKHNSLQLERPVKNNNKLYQFNKKKMESFLYDLRMGIEREETVAS